MADKLPQVITQDADNRAVSLALLDKINRLVKEVQKGAAVTTPKPAGPIKKWQFTSPGKASKTTDEYVTFTQYNNLVSKVNKIIDQLTKLGAAL